MRAETELTIIGVVFIVGLILVIYTIYRVWRNDRLEEEINKSIEQSIDLLHKNMNIYGEIIEKLKRNKHTL